MVPTPALAAIAGDVIWCLGLGLLLALVRDLLGWCIGNGRLLCFLWDLTVFAAAAVALRGFSAGISATGTVRWYMALGMLTGALGWQRAAAGTLQKTGRAVLTLLLLPWRWFLCRVWQPLAKKLKITMKSNITLHAEKQKLHEKKAKTTKKQLQNPVRMLYN